MRYQYFIGLFTLCYFISFFQNGSQSRYLSSDVISKELLKEEIIKRMDRVREMKAMKELAKELGIEQVYLFGGSAAAWSHYVYWDLEREAGIGNYDKSRFDYDYTSIFRANQDMDIVVDVNPGNEHLVQEFERQMQQRFAHFQGDKPAWEVRPLRLDYGAKDKILDNPDFLNQNSDSHSTGLISVTDNDELRIRDFKDWENPDNNFFEDVYNRELHFYRDRDKHITTKRFREGINPEIISVIRYFTKAFQYELQIDEESRRNIEDILNSFDGNRDLSTTYTKNWIEKNGVKLFQNAIDLEFAYNTMKDFNLINILSSIRNNPEKYNSLSWWINRQPLLTLPFSNSSGGKTASQLGIDIVAHETNSFAAYESITKSHSGLANVFISREGATGEAAAHGGGFYTRIGRKGARGSGLTIRFEVDPEAVEGRDFSKSGDYVIFNNKAALRVIPDSLTISLVDYFEKILKGELIFDHSDRGVREKVERRLDIHANNLTEIESEHIYNIIKDTVAEKDQKSAVILKWFDLKLNSNRTISEIFYLLMQSPDLYHANNRDIFEKTKKTIMHILEELNSEEYSKAYQSIEELVLDPTQSVHSELLTFFYSLPISEKKSVKDFFREVLLNYNEITPGKSDAATAISTNIKFKVNSERDKDYIYFYELLVKKIFEKDNDNRVTLMKIWIDLPVIENIPMDQYLDLLLYSQHFINEVREDSLATISENIKIKLKSLEKGENKDSYLTLIKEMYRPDLSIYDAVFKLWIDQVQNGELDIVELFVRTHRHKDLFKESDSDLIFDIVNTLELQKSNLVEEKYDEIYSLFKKITQKKKGVFLEHLALLPIAKSKSIEDYLFLIIANENIFVDLNNKFVKKIKQNLKDKIEQIGVEKYSRLNNIISNQNFSLSQDSLEELKVTWFEFADSSAPALDYVRFLLKNKNLIENVPMKYMSNLSNILNSKLEKINDNEYELILHEVVNTTSRSFNDGLVRLFLSLRIKSKKFIINYLKIYVTLRNGHSETLPLVMNQIKDAMKEVSDDSLDETYEYLRYIPSLKDRRVAQIIYPEWFRLKEGKGKKEKDLLLIKDLLSVNYLQETLVSIVFSDPDFKKDMNLLMMLVDLYLREDLAIDPISILDNLNSKYRGIVLNRLISLKNKKNNNLASRVFSREEYKDQVSALKQLIIEREETVEIIRYALTKPHWKDHPELIDLLIKVNHSKEVNSAIVSYVLTKPSWGARPYIIKKIISYGFKDERLLMTLLNKSHYLNKYDVLDVLLSLDYEWLNEFVFREVLRKNTWEIDPEYLIKWLDNKKLAKLMSMYTLKDERLVDMPQVLEKAVVSRGVSNYFGLQIFKEDKWKQHPYFTEKFNGKEVKYEMVKSYAKKKYRKGCLGLISKIFGP